MLYASLGNSSLLSLIDIFWVVYNALPAQTVGQDDQPLMTVQARRDLLAAVRQRNPALAQRRTMTEHFRAIELRFGEAIKLSKAGAEAAASRVQA